MGRKDQPLPRIGDIVRCQKRLRSGRAVDARGVVISTIRPGMPVKDAIPVSVPAEALLYEAVEGEGPLVLVDALDQNKRPVYLAVSPVEVRAVRDTDLTLEDVMRALYLVGAGQLEHTNSMRCPNRFVGTNSEERGCPACRVLAQARRFMLAAGVVSE